MLQKIRLRPGLDKQSSDTGAEGKWVNGDYMRFRYSFPEKIGGWQQLGSKSLVGAGRDSHTWVDLSGNKYAAIGTNKMLYIYFEGGFWARAASKALHRACNLIELFCYSCWYQHHNIAGHAYVYLH